MKKLLAVVAVVGSAGVFWIAGKTALGDPPWPVVEAQTRLDLALWEMRGKPYPTDAEFHFPNQTARADKAAVMPEHHGDTPRPDDPAALALVVGSAKVPSEDCGFPAPGEERSDMAALRASLRQAVVKDDWVQATRYVYIGTPDPSGLNRRQTKRLLRLRQSVQLFDAAATNDAVRIDELIRAGADPNVEIEGERTMTPLDRAAGCNRPAALQALLAGGARVNHRLVYSSELYSVANSSALFSAVHDDAYDTAGLLLKGGADANAQERLLLPDGGTERGLTVLMSTSNPAMVQLLLRAGADPNRRASDGRTALMVAAGKGNAEVVRVLLKGGADPGLRNAKGQTAADIALAENQEEVLDALGVERAAAAGGAALAR